MVANGNRRYGFTCKVCIVVPALEQVIQTDGVYQGNFVFNRIFRRIGVFKRALIQDVMDCIRGRCKHRRELRFSIYGVREAHFLAVHRPIGEFVIVFFGVDCRRGKRLRFFYPFCNVRFTVCYKRTIQHRVAVNFNGIFSKVADTVRDHHVHRIFTFCKSGNIHPRIFLQASFILV